MERSVSPLSRSGATAAVMFPAAGVEACSLSSRVNSADACDGSSTSSGAGSDRWLTTTDTALEMFSSRPAYLHAVT